MNATKQQPGDTLRVAREQIGAIPDPEIPVVTLADLGILRDIREDADGCIHVTLTPTYSGCPATEAIAADVRQALNELGHHNARVEIVLSPPWTTDWISEPARDKLRAYGIAPPGERCAGNGDGAMPTQVLQFHPPRVACPRCASSNTKPISEFGSTPCKALYRCIDCREPFDYFKPF